MKLRKIICLCLVTTMLSGIFTGCGEKKEAAYKDDEKESVTLTMALPRAKQADADTVLAEVNKKLELLLPNTKLEILWESDMAEKWPNWMAISKKIDIAHSGYATDIAAEVEKKTYISLDDLIDEYAPTLKEHKKTYWYSYDTGVVNGKLYAIPNVQIHIKDIKVMGLGEVWPYADAAAIKEESWSHDKTTEKFWQLIDEALDKAATNGVDVKGKVGLPWYQVAKKGYYFIGGDNSNLCYDNSDNLKIIDFYTTEEFKTYCTYMKKWADKGYVSPDVVSLGNSTYGQRLESSINWDKDTNLIKTNTYNQFVYENPEKTVLVSNIGQNSSYWSIPYTAEHPARAIKFLDLLHSEKGAEIANLLAYGIEGTHYEIVNKEQGDIRAFEYQGQGGNNIKYGIPNWMIGNMMEGMYTVSPYTYEDTTKNAEEYYETRINGYTKHALYGISFDTSNFKSQLSNILKNNAEIAPNIYTGVVNNTDALYEELMKKNKSAGIEEVIKELQKQVDDHLAENK